MANPYGNNPFTTGPLDNPYTPGPVTGVPVPEPIGGGRGGTSLGPGDYSNPHPYANPYGPIQQYLRTNPYGPQGWGQWQQPTDEFSKSFYSKNPQGAIGLYSRAYGGSPGGNLERFLREALGAEYERYMEQNLKPGGENMFFTDRLTDRFGQQARQQWQGQTAYQRGENYGYIPGVGGAGRRS